MMDLTIPKMNAALQRQVDEKLRNLGPFPSDQQVADVNPRAACQQALAKVLSARRILADAQARHPDDGIITATYASYRDACEKVFRAAVDWLLARNEEAERQERQTAEEAAQERAEHLVAQLGLAGARRYAASRITRCERDAALNQRDPAALHVILTEMAEMQATAAALESMQAQGEAA